MRKLLILSHTRGNSNFKIGSHHYANGFLKKGWDVYFVGVPFTMMHKLSGRDDKGIKQIDNRVNEKEFKFIFPITLKKNKCATLLNKINDVFFNKKNSIRKVFFDVVICDYPFFYPYLSSINYNKLIYRPTDNYMTMAGKKVSYFENEISKIADFIVPTSNHVSDNLIDLYDLPTKKITVISNGYDDDFFNHQNNGKKEGAIYIGAVDYRFDMRAAELLAENFSDDVFDIYGPISNDYTDKVKKAESKYNNLRFHGKINYSETPKKMSSAKVGLLLLNNDESNIGRSPMKLWEYAASELNILYSKVSVENCEGYKFLYKYHDYEDLLMKYLKAKNDVFENEYIKLIKIHSWKTKINELEAIILNL